MTQPLINMLSPSEVVAVILANWAVGASPYAATVIMDAGSLNLNIAVLAGITFTVNTSVVSALFAMPAFTAMAVMVEFLLIENGAVYRVDVAVGWVPSSV